MDQGGGGLRVLGIGGEETAVGGFGSSRIVGGFGQFASEEDVIGCFGGEFEGGEELFGGSGGVGLLVEAGEGAVGSGAEGGVAVGDGCGGG